jgi:4-amino-4-deoxy-L-arabinose transferase-like glycosyltransferase
MRFPESAGREREAGDPASTRAELLWGLMLVATVVIAFSFINAASPFSRYMGVVISPDSAVFLYMGRLLRAGGLPYVDAFDHKGPLLYFVNMLGYLLNPRWGIWVVESLFLALGTWSCYRVGRRFSGRSVATAATIITMSYYVFVYSGGNLSEDYALALIFFALLCSTRYFLAHDASPINLLAIGAAGGGVLLLRPNMIGPWIAFTFMIAGWGRSTSVRNRSRELIFLFAGGLAVCVPFVVYYAARGGLDELYGSYVLFNLQYSSSSLDQRAASVVWALRNTLLLLAAFCYYVFALFRTSERRAYFVYLALSFGITWVLSIISGRTYLHYTTPLVPFIVPFVADVLSTATESMAARRRTVVLATIAVIALVPSAIEVRKRLLRDSPKAADVLRTADTLKRLTRPGDRILVFGNKPQLYLESDTISTSKYFYQAPILGLSQQMADEFFGELARDKPPLIVVIVTDSPQTGTLVAARMDAYIRQYYEPPHIAGATVPSGALEVFVLRPGARE